MSNDKIAELARRVEKLEDVQKDSTAQLAVIVKWARWAEKTIKPVYGVGPTVAALFGQLAENLEL
jgi:hypothetical protein